MSVCYAAQCSTRIKLLIDASHGSAEKLYQTGDECKAQAVDKLMTSW